MVLANQRGNITFTMIVLVIAALSTLLLLQTLDNTRKSAYRAIQYETRKLVLQRTKGLLANSMIVDYSLNTHNSPALNMNLKKCIQAPSPTTGGFCTGVPVEFYAIDAAAGEKFSGPDNHPAYVDQFGIPCAETSEACFFKVSTACTFACPEGQATCASTKIMTCDLQVAPTGSQVFRNFLYSKEKHIFVSQYSVQLVQVDASTSSYQVFHMY